MSFHMGLFELHLELCHRLRIVFVYAANLAT